MWHGDPASTRRHITWAKINRFVRHHRAPDDDAARFIESLERAAVDLQAGAGFTHATSKHDHVEELRRVLGLLLDILADWEMITDRTG